MNAATSNLPRPETFKVMLSGLEHALYRWPGPAQATVSPVLLLHGWLDQALSFSELASHLCAQREVWALDFRGHGASQWIGSGGYYHFADYQRDIADLFDLDFSFARGCDVIGHSMGGAVATYAAALFPKVIARLVTLEGFSATHRSPETAPERFKEWLDGLRKVGKGPRYYASEQDLIARASRSFPELDAAQVRLFVQRAAIATEQGFRWRYDPLHLTTSPQPFSAATFIGFASQVKVPVLAVRGSKSSMSGIGDSDIDRRLASFAGPLRLVTMEGAGHMMHLTHSQEVATLITTWLSHSAAAERGDR
jgi:pimeloyl-ACP methyl ester carboxylesterase